MTYFYDWRHDALFRVGSDHLLTIYNAASRSFCPPQKRIASMGKRVTYRCSCRIARRMIVDRVIDEFFAEKSAAVFFNDGGLLLMKEGCDIVRVSVKAGNIVLDSHHGESRGKIGPIGLKPAKELLFALFFYDKTWRVVQCEWLQGEEDSNFEELHVFTDAKSSCIVCEDSAGHSYEFKAEYDSYSRDSVLGKKLGCLVPISKRDCDAKLLISPMQAATIAWRAWCNEKEKFQKSRCSLNNGDEDEWLYRHVADSEQSFWSDYGDDLGPECNWPD